MEVGHTLGVIVCLMMLAIGKTHSQENFWLGPSFTAEMVTFNRIFPTQLLTKSNLAVGSLGIREESSVRRDGRTPYFVGIVNFEQRKSWLIKPSERTYVNMDDANEEEDTGEELAGGVLTNTPCVGFAHSENRGAALYYGAETENWLCTGESDSDSVIQLYDSELGIVVRQEDGDGAVVELRDIIKANPPSALFEVPASYEEITLQEFFTGIRRLPAYQPRVEQKTTNSKTRE